MRKIASLLALFLVACIAIGADAPVRVTGQLLDYQQGYVFFTTGDGFKVSPAVQIVNYPNGVPARKPRARDYVRATFDANGNVTELELSQKSLPQEGDLASVHRFAIALSSPVPNPDLAVATPKANGFISSFSGKPVLVTFEVEVPPTTPLTAQVYITNDQSGWNPQAIPMDRVDVLHFRVTRRFRSGTEFNYLYTRGSLETEERGENNLERTPRSLIVTDADVRTITDTVYTWADQTVNGQFTQPFAIPTPYNPAPFPNLPPGAPGAHTPLPIATGRP